MFAKIGEALASAIDVEDTHRDGRNIITCEAATGVGKTFACAVPGLVLAKSRKMHLIYSSSTISLQEQLINKDIPLLQANLPFAFTFAVAKGRSRYVCASKLMDVAVTAKQKSLLEEDRTTPTTLDLETLVRMAKDFESGEWSGDKDALPFSVNGETWEKIITDRQGCSGSKCPLFAKCAFYIARQKIKDADLIVANHDLVLSALSMPPGSVLPDPAESMIIFDEGHSMTAKGVDHFAKKHTLLGAKEWVLGSVEKVSELVLGLHLDAALLARTETAGEAIAELLDQLFLAIDRTKAFEDKPIRRFKNGPLPAWALVPGGNILSAARSLDAALKDVREALMEKATVDGLMIQRQLSSFGFYLGRVENLVDTWAMILAGESVDAAPRAKWIEKHEGGKDKSEDYVICVCPITAAEQLSELLWRKVGAAVVTSATLTSCGTFQLFLKETGLSRLPKTKLLQLASPFDYEQRASLVVPKMKSNPKNSIAHTKEVIEMLTKLLTSKGSLVLFCSGKQMQEVYTGIGQELQSRILMQGSMGKNEILKKHREAIDEGRQSIIFGLASFSEGVDLPGDYLTHVVITKLPFTVPDDPLQEARREWIEAQGKSAFLELSVPEVGIKLAQGAGRLLRTHTDFGQVTVLDCRLANTIWGRSLLRGLPPFAMVLGKPLKVRLDELEAHLTEMQ